MSGFCLWPSKYGGYNVAQSGSSTDVVAAFVQACKEYGVRPGVYYCILDPHNEGKLDWAGPVPEPYFQLIRQHVTELHTGYPQLFYQLFDIPGKLTPVQRWDLYHLVKQLNPHCLVVMNQTLNISRENQGRKIQPGAWPTDVVNGEDALPPDAGHDPHVEVDGRQYYLPMESWMPAGPMYMPEKNMHAWFWRSGYVTRPADDLYRLYHDSVGRGANLLLNLAPDTQGVLPSETVEQMQRLSRLIAGGHV
jgi:alpha-L-fucosidase